MGLSFDTTSKDGIAALDKHLATKSYITGFQASRDDLAVFTMMKSAPSAKEAANVARWYSHIDALLGSSFPGKAEGVKVAGAGAAAAGAAAAPPADPKKKKAAFKEGGKKAQDICGMCDMGGVYYYTLGMEECENNWELMQDCMDGANLPVAPDAEERKGGADHLGKMFMGFNDDELIIYVHVPKGEKTAALNAADWCSAVCSADGVGGVLLPGADAVWAKAVVKCDKANGKFPIKIKDLAISASISLLRSKQLLPDDEGSDDDVNYGEDLEW